MEIARIKEKNSLHTFKDSTLHSITFRLGYLTANKTLKSNMCGLAIATLLCDKNREERVLCNVSIVNTIPIVM